jgi:hypothetical protein
MEPQRIWPVRGSRRKYSGQFSLRVRPRMDFQNVPPPLVQPGHNEKFVSGGNSFETARREGIRFKPSVRRSFRTLLRRFFTILDRRSNDRDRAQLQPCASHRGFLPSASSFAPACHARFLQASAKRSLFSFHWGQNGSVAATFPVRRHLNVTRRFSSMNQGIRTLIYPVKDARRSFSSSWASILMSNSLTMSPSGSETRKLV